MEVRIIAAVDEDGGIGKDGKLPWGRMRADMKRFKELTTGHAVVMGRKTFESMSLKALPGRRNYVITSRPHADLGDLRFVASFDAAMARAAAEGEEKLWAIGGTAVYEAALAHANHVYLTLVHHRFACDAFFPKVHLHKWVMVEEYPYRSADDDNAEAYTFVEYVPR